MVMLVRTARTDELSASGAVSPLQPCHTSTDADQHGTLVLENIRYQRQHHSPCWHHIAFADPLPLSWDRRPFGLSGAQPPPASSAHARRLDPETFMHVHATPSLPCLAPLQPSQIPASHLVMPLNMVEAVKSLRCSLTSQARWRLQSLQVTTAVLTARHTVTPCLNINTIHLRIISRPADHNGRRGMSWHGLASHHCAALQSMSRLVLSFPSLPPSHSLLLPLGTP